MKVVTCIRFLFCSPPNYVGNFCDNNFSSNVTETFTEMTLGVAESMLKSGYYDCENIRGYIEDTFNILFAFSAVFS